MRIGNVREGPLCLVSRREQSFSDLVKDENCLTQAGCINNPEKLGEEYTYSDGDRVRPAQPKAFSPYRPKEVSGSEGNREVKGKCPINIVKQRFEEALKTSQMGVRNASKCHQQQPEQELRRQIGNAPKCQQQIGDASECHQQIGNAPKCQQQIGETSKCQQKIEKASISHQQIGYAPESQLKIGKASISHQQIGYALESQQKIRKASISHQQIGNAPKCPQQVGIAAVTSESDPENASSKILDDMRPVDLVKKVTAAKSLDVVEREKESFCNPEEEENREDKNQNTTSVIPQSQDQLNLQERQNASEGAVTLLLLADGRPQYLLQSPERAEVYPHPICDSEPNDGTGYHNPEGSHMMYSAPEYRKVTDEEEEVCIANELREPHPQVFPESELSSTAGFHDGARICVMSNGAELIDKAGEECQSFSGGETEEFSTNDDDQDGVLIVDLDESSAVVPVLQSNEKEEPDTVHLSEGSGNKDERGNKQVNNGQCRSNNRFESKKKMEDGKTWLLQTFMVIAGSLSVMKLSDIEESYLAFCQKNGKEPLATPVLARLIHLLFPGAEKCRLGARGNQRIHYRNLKFKCDEECGNQTPKLNNADQPKQSINFTEISKSKQINASENQEDQNEPTVEKSTDKQSVKNFSSGNGKPLQNQTGTEESPKKMEEQASASQDDEENCKAAAKKLSDVLKWIHSQGENHKKALLRDFAHSASCQADRCLPVCMMFRRVRRHVVAAKHCCSVLRLYSMLLRNHVASCTSDDCGLPACPALRATRVQKRPLEVEERPEKRFRTVSQAKFSPASIVCGPRSPGGSLPGSPVNSPPLSPEVPAGGQVLQYVYLPVMVSVIKNQEA